MPFHSSDLKTPEKNVKTAEKPLATKSTAEPHGTPKKSPFFPPLTPVKPYNTPEKLHKTPVKPYKTPEKPHKTPVKPRITPVKPYNAHVGGDFHEVELLHAAILKEDFSYIQSAADEMPMLLDTANAHGNTSVHSAALTGALASLQKLKECGANVYICNKEGRNIAHLAVYSARIAILEEFHVYKGNMNLIAKDGFTPAHLAVIKNNIDVIKALIKCNANFNQKSRINIDVLEMIICSLFNTAIMSCLKVFIKKNNKVNSNYILISPYEIALVIDNPSAVKLIAELIAKQQKTTEKYYLLSAKYNAAHSNQGKPITEQGDPLSPVREKCPRFYGMLTELRKIDFDGKRAPYKVN